MSAPGSISFSDEGVIIGGRPMIIRESSASTEECRKIMWTEDRSNNNSFDLIGLNTMFKHCSQLLNHSSVSQQDKESLSDFPLDLEFSGVESDNRMLTYICNDKSCMDKVTENRLSDYEITTMTEGEHQYLTLRLSEECSNWSMSSQKDIDGDCTYFSSELSTTPVLQFWLDDLIEYAAGKADAHCETIVDCDYTHNEDDDDDDDSCSTCSIEVTKRRWGRTHQ